MIILCMHACECHERTYACVVSGCAWLLLLFLGQENFTHIATQWVDHY